MKFRFLITALIITVGCTGNLVGQKNCERCTDCRDCYLFVKGRLEILTERYESIESINNRLFNRLRQKQDSLNSLDKILTDFRVEIDNLKTQNEEIEKLKYLSKNLPAYDPTEDINDLEQKIKILRIKNGHLLNTIEELKKQIEDQNKVFVYKTKALKIKHKASLDSLNIAINQLRSTLQKTKEKLQEANLLIACITEATNKVEVLKRDAQPALDSARYWFDRYKSLAINNDKKPATTLKIESYLNGMFDIYNQYSSRPVTSSCGTITINNVVEFMDARDHLNMAYILAKDPRHLINSPRYGKSTDQRAAKINADLIYHIGQVYEKQKDYGEREEINRLVSQDLLPVLNVLPTALLSSENINANDTTSGNNIILRSYAQIPIKYEQGKYIEAIGLYNRFYRLEGEEGIKSQILLKAKVYLAVGTILLFDLGQVYNVYGVTLNGSWLKETLPISQRKGTSMLKEVINLNGKEEELLTIQQRAAYLLSKRYEPESKSERQRRKLLRRQSKS